MLPTIKNKTLPIRSFSGNYDRVNRTRLPVLSRGAPLRAAPVMSGQKQLPSDSVRSAGCAWSEHALHGAGLASWNNLSTPGRVLPLLKSASSSDKQLPASSPDSTRLSRFGHPLFVDRVVIPDPRNTLPVRQPQSKLKPQPQPQLLLGGVKLG